MKFTFKLTHVFSIFLIPLLLSCHNNTQKQNKRATPEFKSILIHCGVTMVKPISKIAEIIERQENCKVLITKGGSGNLYRSITENKIGDLYISGSEKYIENGIKEGYITEKVLVGMNKAAVMVQKGNPKDIPNNISALINPTYRIAIGNPNSGSIGKETKRILTQLGYYDEVSKRAIYKTIDSRDLIEALKKDEVDIVINWCATSTWNDNKDYVEALKIDHEVLKPKRLYLSRLIFAQHPDIAEKFMRLAASSEGNKIFRQYGLYFDETSIKNN